MGGCDVLNDDHGLDALHNSEGFAPFCTGHFEEPGQRKGCCDWKGDVEEIALPARHGWQYAGICGWIPWTYQA